MKLILTQEVDGLGAAGDVVEVKDGYGRNYLVPRGVRDHDHAAQIKSTLESAPVDVKVRAGAGGRLFGAGTVTDIADAIAAVSGEKVDKRTIVVTNPIKSLGNHQVSVKLRDDVSASVALNVIPA